MAELAMNINQCNLTMRSKVKSHPPARRFMAGLESSWLGRKLAALVFKLLVAWSAVDVDSQAAFKYRGGLRQWLLHGFFFVGASLGFFLF